MSELHDPCKRSHKRGRSRPSHHQSCQSLKSLALGLSLRALVSAGGVGVTLVTLVTLVTSGLIACSDPVIEGLEAGQMAGQTPAPSGATPPPPGGAEGATEGGAPPLNPYLPRPTEQTCALPTPTGLVGMTLVRGERWALRSPTSVALTAARPDGLAVTERGGQVWWRSTGAQPVALFDASPSVEGADEGLYALAFHPQLSEHPWAFTLKSSARCEGGARCVTLSRWPVSLTAGGLSVESAGEERLLEVPYLSDVNLRGGLIFGVDGYLYVSLGAGGPQDSAEGPLRAQLKGSVLRLNVNEPNPSCGTLYSPAPTNPFAASGCERDTPNRAELWAWGFEAPHHLSVDPVSGALWVSDHGAEGQEVNRVVGGVSYQDLPPLYQHASPSDPSTPLRALVPAGVYRGDELPELKGHYLLADARSGEVIAFQVDNPSIITRLVAAEAPINAQGAQLWLSDTNGALSLAGAASGGPTAQLLTLEPDLSAASVNTTPRLLSETGCMSADGRGWAPSVVPYSVNHPFWSDLATKERAFALPVGAQIGYRPAGEALEFPVGSVLLKHLSLTSRSGVEERFETRIMQHTERGWVGHTYRWREDGSDADLLTEGLNETLSGPYGTQAWSFLDPSACLECHTAASGRALGLEVAQLNRPLDLAAFEVEASGAGSALNQLEALEEAGYLTLPQPASDLPQLLRPEVDSDDLTREVREYIQVNCASCHRPEGVPHLSFDLRANIPLSEAGLCDALPVLGDLGIPNARLLVPGDPERSLLLTRMRERGPEQMPPLGTNIVDYEGIALVTFWISQLEGCE